VAMTKKSIVLMGCLFFLNYGILKLKSRDWLNQGFFLFFKMLEYYLWV